MKNFKLNGDEILLKSQLRAIKGGQNCTLKITIGPFVTFHTQGGYDEGPAGSAQANADCVDLIVTGIADRCGYDCEWDNPPPVLLA